MSKLKSTPKEEWDLHKPILNPPNLEPGWYFITLDRDGEPYSLGPFKTKKLLNQMRAMPCYAHREDGEQCKGLVWFDPKDPLEVDRETATRMAGGGVSLCKDCNREFIEDYTKEHGHPPRPVGEQ